MISKSDQLKPMTRAFRVDLNEARVATEQLAKGIRKYVADQRRLVALLKYFA